MTASSPTVGLSAVIPCLNESENVAAIAAAVVAEFEKTAETFEIIFIDNASTDDTVKILKDLCAKDTRIRLIVNNQNYGQMRSPTHAIYQTCGRAVIGICADFQDPPEMIGIFVDRWRAGAKVVLGVRQSETTSLVLKTLRAIGYGFFERFGDYRVIPGATGFGLYAREVVDCLKEWRDPEPFFRGMLVESGFPIEVIPYHRPQRVRGTTKNSLSSLFSFAVSGLASSSKKLLRLPISIGIFFGLAAILTLVVGATQILRGYVPWPLIWLTLAECVCGLLFFFLGLIGDQVRLISSMVRNAPLVIEKERVNFPSNNQ